MLPSTDRSRAVLRVALSHYATIGLSAAVGLLLISTLAHLLFGAAAAAYAAVGAIVVIPPDQPAPKHHKVWQLVPAALVGAPLFWAVQTLHTRPGLLALLLVPATFLAFLGAAWGKRGLPVSMSIMLALVFSLAVAPGDHAVSAWQASGWFVLGGLAYMAYATASNALLNGRYRALLLSDTLQAMARLMRTQAAQFTSGTDESALLRRLLAQQAALADHLQTARNLLLESPHAARRQQLAGMLVQSLELRDHVVACGLDLDLLAARPDQRALCEQLKAQLQALADQVDRLADALLLGRDPAAWAAAPPAPDPGPVSDDVLARSLVARLGYIRDEVRRLTALARGEQAPDLAAVRANWQLFVSPTVWTWQPITEVKGWDAPPLRHALRAALAVAAGLGVGWLLPWGTHEYWILLTIALVLRGSLAQTLERRNERVIGTLLGCVIAGALLVAQLPAPALMVVVALSQGVAHAFAIRRYVVTAVAATVLALLQAHQINADANPAFEVLERVADTLIGVAIAWAFSYVMPAWERSQMPALVARTRRAHARHAQLALALGQLQAVDNQAEVGWRLARREVYDSLSALAQAAQRALVEPKAVRPPLAPLGRLLAHSYQLIAQLTSVKTMLLLRRDRLQPALIQAPLQAAADAVVAALEGPPQPCTAVPSAVGPAPLPPQEHDLSPWLLRRLDLATDIARRLRADADAVDPSGPDPADTSAVQSM